VGQKSATVQGVPETIGAGELLDLTVTVDEPPDFDYASVIIYLAGQSGSFPVQGGCSLPKGETKCNFRYPIPPDAASGTWSVDKLIFSSGIQRHDLVFSRIPFQVIARSHLTIPKSAQVVINPSQIQVLRREVYRLEAEVQSLKEDLRARPHPLREPFAGELRNRIKDEIERLDSTESQFRKIGDEKDTAVQTAAKAFFDDLRFNYLEVLRDLAGSRAGSSPGAFLVVPVALDQGSEEGRALPLVALGVLRPFELNQLAYSFVASNPTFWFDLEVKSFPQGAAIRYRRRGMDYKAHSEPTNSRLRGLPLAIVSIMLQLDGYQDKEVEYNPYVDSSGTVTVNLSKVK
jgi:hypothetical protein